MTDEAYIEKLLAAAPELQSAFSEHIADNGVLLPHVFLGDVTRLIAARACVRAHQPSLKELLDGLDDGLRCGSPNIKELILVSFVENLNGHDEATRCLLALVGPTLRTALHEG